MPQFTSPPDGTLCVTFAGGHEMILYVTSDGGETWQAASELLPIPGTDFGDQTFADAQYGWIPNRNLLYRATDGGHLWEQIVVNVSSIKDVQFVSRTQGWLLTLDGLLCTTADGGLSWERVMASLSE